MANASLLGKIYLDSTGSVADRTIKVAHILFTPSTANDQLILSESASGSNCISIQSSTAKTTMHFDFSYCPIIFNNGIYVKTLTSGATATLVTTRSGN